MVCQSLSLSVSQAASAFPLMLLVLLLGADAAASASYFGAYYSRWSVSLPLSPGPSTANSPQCEGGSGDGWASQSQGRISDALVVLVSYPRIMRIIRQQLQQQQKEQ